MSFLKNKLCGRVAIIGRPNVGKSSLFNVLSESRRAVVKDQPGVTRDILIESAEVWGKHFEIIDTGGLTETADSFSHLIREQILALLAEIDLLLVVMDGRAGLCPEDRDVVKIAQESAKPYLIIVNKVDRVASEAETISEFFEFGKDVIAAAFEQRRGIAEIMEWLSAHLVEGVDEVKEGINLAIVGKPNVGKSSLCNCLLGERRMIVSEVAGTTVDSVDAQLTIKGKQYTLVDTAGLRKSARRKDDVEILSAFKTTKALKRADIVLLMIDGVEGPSEQDAKILENILENHKGVIVVANKSDLATTSVPEYRKAFREQIRDVFHFFPEAMVCFVSAKTGQGLDKLFDAIDALGEKLAMRIPTSELNDFFFETIRKAPAPVYRNKDVKFYYLTQTHQVPPSFIAFANFPDGVTPAYRRFLAKQVAERFDLKGIPIRIFVLGSRGE